MSKTVDERVVEMRFDNKNFEKNVSASMSTIDKLKQKLHFKGATDGLDNLGKAAKNVNFSPLSRGVETVQAKFSALQVVGTTALVNITNQAINAGKRITSALTIDPIKTGFQEYETQMGAIQTILANTQKEGTNVERVNAALDELNLYADKTIYNFTEMTRNIGTFTAAGVKLDDSVQAIKGIANLAAVSGSTSTQASTAMYQLSQALAAGKVSLMDWNSVVNAGMGGQVFQDALVRTSEHLKTGAKEAIKSYGSFRESLTKGDWLTTEVLTETLNQIAGAYSKAELMAQGYTETQAEEIKKLADTATSAATEVKTFTQLWDTLKEAAQSGWSQTWRMIVGDFDKAKERMTKLSDVLGNAIGKSADARNKMFGGALNSSWDKLNEKLKTAGVTTEKFQNKIIELSGTHRKEFEKMIETEGSFEKGLKKAFSKGIINKSTLKDAIKSFAGDLDKATNSTKSASDQMEKYGKIVDKVILGDYGNGADRVKALTDAGYEYATIQNLVNEKLGVSYRHLEALNDEQLKNADSLSKLSDEQLKSQGYTKEQIKALRELSKAADESGSSIDELLNDMVKPSGSELIWDSIYNVIESVIAAVGAVKKAWNEAFHPGMTEDQIIAERSEKLYKLIEAIHAITEKFKVNDEVAGELTRTFKGLFAILDIITTILGGGFKLAYKVLSKILGAFNLDLLEFTALLGDAVVKFRDFLFNNKIINKTFDLMADGIIYVAKAIKNLYNAFIELPFVRKIIDNIKEAFDNLKKLDFKEIGSNIIEGLKNGLSGGISGIISKIIEIAKSIISTIRDILGIHSPSTVMFEIGKNIIEGLINGIKAAVGGLINGIKWIGNKISELFSNTDITAPFESIGAGFDKLKDILSKFDYSKLLAIIPIGAVLLFAKKLYDLGSVLAEGITGINDVLEGFALIEKKIANVIDAYALSIKADAVKKIAISLGILVAAIVVLTLIDTDKLYDAVIVIGILAGILVGLTYAMNKLEKSSISYGKGGLNIEGLKTSLLSIGAALLLLGITVKMIGKLSPEQAKQGFLGLAGLIAAVVVVFAAIGYLVNDKATENINKFGSMLVKMSIALMLLVVVVKLVSKLEPSEMIKGGLFVGAFILFVGLLSAMTRKTSKNIDKLGKVLVKLSISLLLMVAVCKLVGMLSVGEIVKGIAFTGSFIILIGLLTALTKISSEQKMAKVGRMTLALSVSLGLMVGVCKLVGLLSVSDMIKGGIFAAAFAVLIAVLVKVTTINSEQQVVKMAGTILAMSLAIGILAGISVLLSMMSLSGLAKGVAAVTVLGLMMAEMIAATKGANKIIGNLIVMTIAIATMTGAVIILSNIDPSRLAGATIAISTIMGMFALMITTSSGAQSAIPALLTITLVVAALGGVIWLLSGLDPNKAIAISDSLSKLLLSMSVVIGILTVVGLGGPAALIGIGSLLALIKSLGILMAAIGALVKNIPELEEFVNKAIPILGKIGEGLGSFFGGIVKGFSEQVISILPTLGQSLSDFMTKAGVFIDGCRKIDADTLAGATMLTAMILELSVAKFISGVTDILSLGTSYKRVGQNLSDLMTGMDGFLKGLENIESDKIEAAKMLADVILTISEAGLLNSLSSLIDWFSGNPVEEFGEALPKLGDGIKKYAESVEGINNDDVKASAESAKILAELANNLPDTGFSIKSLIAGGSDSMSEFGDDLVSFGEAMSEYSKSIEDINPRAVKASAEAGKMLSELANNLPDTGISIKSLITGGPDDLETFGEDLEEFGKSLTTYSESVSGIKIKKVETSVDAAKALVEISNSLPDTGFSFKQVFAGGQDSLEQFGKDLEMFGKGISMYSDSVENLKVDNITTSIDAAKKFVEIGKIYGDEGGTFDWLITDGNELKTNLVAFGEAITAYSKSVVGIKTGEDFDASISAISTLVDVANSLSNTGGIKEKLFGTKDLASFVEQLEPLGEGLKKYSESIGDIDTAKVSASATATKDMVGILTELSSIGNSTKSNVYGPQLLQLGDKNDFDVSVISKLTSFVEQLEPLGQGIKKYSDSIGEIDTDKISNSATATTKIVGILTELASVGKSTKSITNGPLASVQKTFDLKNQTSFDTTVITRLTSFIEQLEPLGNGITKFYNTISGIEDTDKLKSTATAMKTIMTALNDMMSEMDSKEDIDISYINVIGNSLRTFASHMIAFSGMTKNGVDSDSITKVADAAGSMIDAYKSISEYSEEIGDNTDISYINTIGNSLRTFASHMIAFSGMIKDNVDTTAITEAETSAKSMIDMYTTISKYIDEIDSDVDTSYVNVIGSTLRAFVSQMIQISGMIKGGIDNASIISAKTSAESLLDLYESITSYDIGLVESATLSAIGDNLITIIEDTVTFSEKASGLNVSNLDSGVDAVKKITEMLKGMTGLSAGGSLSLKNAVNNIAETNVAGFVNAFKGETQNIQNAGKNIVDSLAAGMSQSSKTVQLSMTTLITGITTYIVGMNGKFKALGVTIIGEFGKGINDGSKTVITIFTTTIKSAISSISMSYMSFYNAGMNLGEGLVLGINAKQTSVYNAAYALGQMAVQGEKDGQQSHSPSKATEKAGKWLGQGLIIGINKISTDVYRSGYSLGDTVTTTISTAISKTKDLIENGVDSQPTIRPVLDLSSVESGSRLISTMFNDTFSIGTSANVGAISSMVNESLQNGNNDDVVSAINKLRNDLSNVRGDTYNVNGITYDDGTNVSNAVQSLVRAARIERRV